MKSKQIKAAALLLCALILGGCGNGSGAADEVIDENAASQNVADEGTADENVPGENTGDENTAEENGLPDVFPLELFFSSGAGAWSTSISLNRDGTFEGAYSDADMGDSGEGYPNGKRYVCKFSGQFTEIREVDETSYSLTLEELRSDYEDGKEWIEDGVLYVSSVPYGMEEGTDFILYLPETPVDGLSEELLSWWPKRFAGEEERPDTLELYGLYNVEMGYGFFG